MRKRTVYKGKYVIASGPVIIEKMKNGKGKKMFHVLLDKHGEDDFWKFPGSSVKRGESFEECAKKRVKGELGIDVKLIRPLKPFIIWKKDETIILVHYLAKRRGKIKPGKHVREWGWFEINGVLKNDKGFAPNIKPVLKEFKSSKII